MTDYNEHNYYLRCSLLKLQFIFMLLTFFFLIFWPYTYSLQSSFTLDSNPQHNCITAHPCKPPTRLPISTSLFFVYTLRTQQLGHDFTPTSQHKPYSQSRICSFVVVSSRRGYNAHRTRYIHIYTTCEFMTVDLN